MPACRTRDTLPRSTLEVSTDVPQPPVLNIVSPTPRAFTFPISHNLADSPYSSPSHSPFEPDLRSLVLSCTPPPAFLRNTPDSTSSLSSPSTSSPSSSSSHKRRKSSCSSDIVERRPRKGDEDYIKRPENAFILFRRKCCEDRQAAQEEASSTDGPNKKQRQADLSKTISQQWKSLSTDERQYWENLAKEKKKEHEAMYPNYVYRPQRAKDKDGRPKSRKPKGRRGEDDDDVESLSFVVPIVPPHQRHHGRSASAPTPPPYQSIQVPSVYSCPTSPSLLPMISRRSSHPDHEDPMCFDFNPHDRYSEQSSYQSSEFLQNMFSMAGMQPRDSLHPLDVSESMLLPAHQIVSPSSSISSMPSSPHTGPLTPRSAILSQGYPLHPTNTLDDSSDSSQEDLDLQMEMQLQQEYAQFSWTNATNSWQSPSELLLGNDFELSAIPPIELGGGGGGGVVSKGGEESQSLSAMMEMEYNHHQSQCGQEYSSSLESPTSSYEQGIVAFDQMMAGHGF